MPRLAIKTIDIADLLRQAAAREAASEQSPESSAPEPATSAIETYPVYSAAISIIKFDPEAEECIINFSDGTSYLRPLSRSELNKWLNSKSIGGYWNRVLRGRA
jgi:hypothetical protein